MQYWYCSVSKGFVIADYTGSIVGMVDDEHQAASVADLAYHRDDRHDLVLANILPHF